MTIRERLGNPVTNSPAATVQARPRGVVSPVLDVQCVHRSWSAVGKIKCGCSSSPEVFTCAEPWVPSGYCCPKDPTPGKFPPDGPILLWDGSKLTPGDERRAVYNAWPLRTDETPRPWDVPICSTCPKRIEPPPHIKRIRELGINGNWEPDTGHADIVHCLTMSAAWSGHSADWLASGPVDMRAVSVAADKPTDLAAIIEATGGKLLILHSSWCDPNAIASAAVAFPAVRFWGVLHGSQNSMILAGDWSKRQAGMLDLSKRLPNVWYGTPEPTVPFAAMGFERYLTWVNTLADTSVFDPRIPDPSPATLLIAGRDENIKGLPAAVLTAGLVNQRVPVKVVACVRGNVGPLTALAASVGVPFESRGFLPLPAFRAFVRQSMSILVTPSLSDAFQYTGWDVLTQGRPVVGSRTIRYLPAEWQADPNDPADIARVTMEILNDYGAASQIALNLGREIIQQQQAAYHAAIARILER